jgi:CHRD domain
MAMAFAAFPAALPWPALAQAAGAARTFQARLSTVPIDLTMASTIAGNGSVTGTLKGRTLVLAGKFTGLKTPATVARVHRGPTRGMRGDSIFDLTVNATGTSGELSGTLELSAAQVEDLEKGRIYVQLHSEKAPEGNLWGWLLGKA